MQWASASDFWAMGGYGLYVWGSFGVSALCMLVEAWWVARSHAQACRALKEQISTELAEESSSKSDHEASS